jgi:hypothetical protein
MIAPVIGVIEQKHVAFVDIVAKKPGYRFGSKGQGPDMDGHVLGLSDQPAVEPANRGREVTARIEDLRIGGAKHRLAHLFDDCQQTMLNDRCDDRI